MATGLSDMKYIVSPPHHNIGQFCNECMDSCQPAGRSHPGQEHSMAGGGDPGQEHSMAGGGDKYFFVCY